MNLAEVETPLEPVSSRQLTKGRRFLMVIGALLVIPAILGGSQGWTRYRESRFRAECEVARGRQDWRSERKIADSWVAWNPETQMGWWCAAEACQQLNDLEGMAHYLGKVPRSDPKALLAYIEKANLEWTTLNRPIDAVQTSHIILEIDPEIVEVQSRLISFYAMNLQRVPMLQAIRHSMKHHAQTREAFVYYIMADMLSFTNGASLNSRWLASAPDEIRFKIGLGVHTAMAFAMNVDATRTDDAVAMEKEAEQQLNWFLEKNPEDTALLTYMMHRAYQAGDTQRVEQYLQQVAGDAVEDHMVWVYRAWYHHSLGQLEAAEEAVHEAIRLHPASPLAHHEYANILRKKGELDKVSKEQRLASTGRELRTRLLRIPNAGVVDAEALIAIAKYLRDCGDQLAYDSLEERLQSFGYTAEESPEAKQP